MSGSGAGARLLEVASLLYVWRATLAQNMLGCTDSAASNFNASAETEDGSCTYGAEPCPSLNAKLERSDASCFVATNASATWVPAWPTTNTGPTVGSLTLANSEQWIIQGLPGVPTPADEGRPRPPGSILPFRIHADPGAYLTLRYTNIAPTTGRSEQGGGVYVSGGTVRLEAVVLESSELSAHDGAGIFANQAAKLFLVGCTLRTKSVKGGGISAQSHAEITISESLFDGCTSFSHAGGAIYASPEPNTVGSEPFFKQGTGGVKLDISSTTFRNSQGTAAPPEVGGKALYLAECAQVKMVNTVFDPFDVKTLVTITPAEQLLVLAGSGCTEYPCSPGQACSYSKLSLQCTPCPSGTIGDGTGICQACTPGKEPNEGLTGCEDCSSGQYSQFGTLCQQCPVGQFVNERRTGCTACHAGEGAQGGMCVKCSAGQYSTHGECQDCRLPNVVSDGSTSCVPCTAGFGPVGGKCVRCGGANYSTLGQCQVCQWPNVVDGDRTSCTACKPGQEPDKQQSSCIDCTGANFSTQGAKCETCNHPNVVNTDGDAPRSKCSACPAGKGPNDDHTGCNTCSHGANFSTFGLCQDCPAPNVVNSDRTQCEPCPPGRGPTHAHTGCEPCANVGEYSSNGVCNRCPTTKYVSIDRKRCAECPPGRVSNSDQTGCQLCETGYYSNAGGACEECKEPNVVSGNGTACTKCPAGQGVVDSKCEACIGRSYSVSGECRECSEPRVVDASHTTCSTCPAGHAPNTTGTGCVKCEGARYSTFGDRCQKCEDSRIVDAAHASCNKCDSGKQPNVDQTECVSCASGKYSSLGVSCEKCKFPNVVSDGNTSCVPCTAGFGPVGGKCVRCEGANYSTLGQCQVCQWPNVVDGDHTSCTRCPAGRAPATSRSVCATCVGSTYSTDGSRCVDCIRPMVLNHEHTACTRCRAGRGPNANFSSCDLCEGSSISTFGEPCKPCGKETTANQNNTDCVAPFGCMPGLQCKRGPGRCTHEDECEQCPPGRVSQSVGSACTQCLEGTGQSANPERTACVRCPPGKAPSDDLDRCVACTGLNFSRTGVNCVPCLSPRVVSVTTTDNIPARSECSKCPSGQGPNEEQTGCQSCIGNSASESGQCVPCTTGKIADTDRSGCRDCGERKAYVQGYSDRHGVCGCAPGYYDARTTLIVCLQNGFISAQQETEFDKMCDTGDLTPNGTVIGNDGSVAYAPICLKCPECADCSGEHFPALRDGYVLGRTRGLIDSKRCAANTAAGKNADIAAQSRGIYYAFLCEADTAVTPSDVTEFTYFTNEQANERCNHSCTLGRHCNATLEPLTLRPSAAGNLVVASSGYKSSCSHRYDGRFCQSCATGFYQTEGHKGKGDCDACEKEATNKFCTRHGYNMCALSIVGFLLAIPALYGLFRCIRRWYRRLCHKRAVRTSNSENMRGSDVVDPLESLRQTRPYMEMSDSTRWTCCGLSREDLTVLKVAVFPAIKILITYFQVAGQLSSVLHVQYPQKYSEGIEFFRPLLDFYSVFFRADCTTIWGHHLGSFEAHWMLRVCGQPVAFLLLVEVICFMSVWAGYSTKAEAQKSRTQNQLRAAFLCYPTICNLCFSSLNCIADTSDTKVLVDDDRVQCPDPHWAHWLSTDGIRPLQLASIMILVFFGFGAPMFYIWRVFRASRKGAEEIRLLTPVRDMASKELPDYPETRKLPDGRASMRRVSTAHRTAHIRDVGALASTRLENRAQMDEERIRERIEVLWTRTWRYSAYRMCCCSKDVPVPDSFVERQTRKLKLKLELSWRSEQVTEDVEAAYIESMKLRTFSSLTESYRPKYYYCYWEGIDMLRKFFLVGAVVLAGRGSVLQNVISTFLSFLFFAFHVKMWPHKTNEDNILKATCEIHVFWTITTAFVMRSDLAHEQLQKDFYDWSLLISFVVCVPLSVLLTVSSKLIRAKNARLDSIIEVPNDKRRRQAQIPMHEFRRYTLGLSSMNDRRALKDYFQAMLSTALVGPEDEADQTAASPVASGAPVSKKRKVIGELLDKLGYSEQDQEDLLQKLTEQHQRSGRLKRAIAHVAQCCVCYHRPCCGPAEDDRAHWHMLDFHRTALDCDAEGMIVYVEVKTQVASTLRLVLENDGSETIEGLKQMIHHKQGTHEDDHHLVLVFGNKVLDDNRSTVAECGIASNDTLELRENGFTFKMLAREHKRRLAEQKRRLEQEGLSLDEAPQTQHQVVPNQNARNVGSGVALEEPLVSTAASITRPASPHAEVS